MKNIKAYDLRVTKGVAHIEFKRAVDEFHAWAEKEEFAKKMTAKQDGIFDKAKYLLYLFSTFGIAPDSIMAFPDFIEITLNYDDGRYRLNVSDIEVKVHRFVKAGYVVAEAGKRVHVASVANVISFERLEDVVKNKKLFIATAAKKPAAKKN